MWAKFHGRPGVARFATQVVAGGGFVVISPEGKSCSQVYEHRHHAAAVAADLQAVADAKAKRGKRNCMCCAKPFDSEGIHNRMCDPCRNRAGKDALGDPVRPYIARRA